MAESCGFLLTVGMRVIEITCSAEVVRFLSHHWRLAYRNHLPTQWRGRAAFKWFVGKSCNTLPLAGGSGAVATGEGLSECAIFLPANISGP